MRLYLILAICAIVTNAVLGAQVDGHPKSFPDKRGALCYFKDNKMYCEPISAQKNLLFGIQLDNMGDLHDLLIKAIVNFADWATEGLLEELKIFLEDTLIQTPLEDDSQNVWTDADNTDE